MESSLQVQRFDWWSFNPDSRFDLASAKMNAASLRVTLNDSADRKRFVLLGLVMSSNCTEGRVLYLSHFVP
jgi:predicted metalloenzyme YecM